MINAEKKLEKDIVALPREIIVLPLVCYFVYLCVVMFATMLCGVCYCCNVTRKKQLGLQETYGIASQLLYRIMPAVFCN